MGIYINPENANFKMALNSEIFVDKSMFISKISKLLNTEQRFMCISRPRRFGKSMIGKMMSAYFSKGCDSREIFSNLKIAKDPCFEENLNKFNVLTVDFGAIFNMTENRNDVLKYLRKEFLEDFRNEFPDIAFSDEDSIAKMIQRVYVETKTQFIIIIDEYDTLIRERQNNALLEEYRSFLNSLFKNNELSPAIALAYLTGILPIQRDRVQSKLNNFKEYTMLAPAWSSEFFGFTKEETEFLCNKYSMSFEECENWYDGYKIGEFDIYNPNSVVEAMMRRRCANYWNATGSYEVVSDYIRLDFDGTKSAIADMLAGREIRADVEDFENSLDKINTKDNVLAYLVHLGYLNYNSDNGTCRIPNKEIRQEWEKAIKVAENFSKIAEMIKDSEELLELVRAGAADEVAAALDNAHSEVSSLKNYNREASLQAAIMLAFYTARTKYTVIQELPSGYGFADIGFIPIDKKDPAIVVELKCNQDADTAIKQIKNKNYPKVFENYLDNLLLVGVSYDKETKAHECVIEKFQK